MVSAYALWRNKIHCVVSREKIRHYLCIRYFKSGISSKQLFLHVLTFLQIAFLLNLHYLQVPWTGVNAVAFKPNVCGSTLGQTYFFSMCAIEKRVIIELLVFRYSAKFCRLSCYIIYLAFPVPNFHCNCKYCSLEVQGI